MFDGLTDAPNAGHAIREHCKIACLHLCGLQLAHSPVGVTNTLPLITYAVSVPEYCQSMETPQPHVPVGLQHMHRVVSASKDARNICDAMA